MCSKSEQNPCQRLMIIEVLLALKIFFQLYNYTLNLLFLHIPESSLLITKFLNALYIQDAASLEVEVKSISLIISKAPFFHCFLFLPGIYIYSILFQKLFLQKVSYRLTFFHNLENQATFSCFFLNLKAQYLNLPIQLQYKSLRSNVKSYYMQLKTLVLNLMP